MVALSTLMIPIYLCVGLGELCVCGKCLAECVCGWVSRWCLWVGGMCLCLGSVSGSVCVRVERWFVYMCVGKWCVGVGVCLGDCVCVSGRGVCVYVFVCVCVLQIKDD